MGKIAEKIGNIRSEIMENLERVSPRRNIALIGARGAGKSKVARKLARQSGLTALSTDTLISYEEQGRTIASIVARYGWEGFRQQEYEILKKVCAMRSVIIDCGGGILIEAAEENGVEPVSQRKIELLQESSFVVYLRRETDYLLKKVTKGDPNRPDLHGSYIRLLERRLPLYEKYSDLTLDMAVFDVDAAVEILNEKLPSILTVA